MKGFIPVGMRSPFIDAPSTIHAPYLRVLHRNINISMIPQHSYILSTTTLSIAGTKIGNHLKVDEEEDLQDLDPKLDH